MHTFPNDKGAYSTKFNRNGTRLHCGEVKRSPVVYDVSTEQQTNGKVRFSAKGYSISDKGRNLHCFAGQDDELVVSASNDHNLYVWSLPRELGREQVVNQSVAVLRGHENNVLAVRYNSRTSTLASADFGGTIRLWAPINDQ